MATKLFISVNKNIKCTFDLTSGIGCPWLKVALANYMSTSMGGCHFFFFFILEGEYFILERDRAWVREGQRERETKNLKQAPGSELSAQSPTQGSNPWTVRSWPEPKSGAQPTEPRRSPISCPFVQKLVTILCTLSPGPFYLSLSDTCWLVSGLTLHYNGCTVMSFTGPLLTHILVAVFGPYSQCFRKSVSLHILATPMNRI